MQDIIAYSQIVRDLRYFFQERLNFVEVPAQSRLSILAACKDPSTITQFHYDSVNYPLPQTRQMWLEEELLKNPRLPGVFCVTTSYRNEPNPIPGRHDKIFPMFEFESHGTIHELRQIEADLLAYLGFSRPHYVSYDNMCDHYATEILTPAHETNMQKELGDVISLEYFPRRSHPFWNMQQANAETYNKIDVLLHGMETIGSAERSCNPQQMRDNFFTISEGQYAALLFKTFGEKRVMKELDAYLAHKFFPRFGGGIGLTRLARAMKLEDLLEQQKDLFTTA